MDLAAIEQDVRTRVQDFVTRAEEDVTRGREILEQHLPALAKAADTIQGSAIVQALEGAILSPADEAFIASLVKRLDTAAAQAGTPPATGDTPAPLDDAQQAMADAAAPAQGPQVGGVA